MICRVLVALLRSIRAHKAKTFTVPCFDWPCLVGFVWSALFGRPCLVGLVWSALCGDGGDGADGDGGDGGEVAHLATRPPLPNIFRNEATSLVPAAGF